jgi:hypothetical protein
MLSFYVSLVSTGASALANVIGNSSQTGILVTLGSLLFVLGTVLRRNLPALDETTSSYPSALRVDPIPLKLYVGIVDNAVNTGASRTHANAV